jgi:hypothetical protein
MFDGGIRSNISSAELKGCRKLLRIRPEIFDFEPDEGLKLGQTKLKTTGTVPTNRHTTIPIDSGPEAVLHNIRLGARCRSANFVSGRPGRSSSSLRGCFEPMSGI